MGKGGFPCACPAGKLALFRAGSGRDQGNLFKLAIGTGIGCAALVVGPDGGRSLVNGLFLLSGAFWMGTVEAARKQLEPQRLAPWLRFGVIAFAASLIGRMIFPCDLNCPLDGSATQLVHNTLVWVLYAGALIAGWRVPNLTLAVRLLKWLLLVCFVLLQWAFWHRDAWPGLWQRGYELSFAVLWLIWVHYITRVQSAKADR